MSPITIKQLLEAGVHFGHQTARWNPKMKKYIFGERNGIYIINLELTLACLEKALVFLKQVAAEGKDVLFVGTKKQAQIPLKEAAALCGMPYVNQRWLGGMLTNFETIRKSIKKLDSIDKMEQDGSFQFITKKEIGSLKKEREKLIKNLSGDPRDAEGPRSCFCDRRGTREDLDRRSKKTRGFPSQPGSWRMLCEPLTLEMVEQQEGRTGGQN